MCEKCSEMFFTRDVGTCSGKMCVNHTSSGSFTYCVKCSITLGKCSACGEDLTEEEKKLPSSIVLGED